jgi:NDP-sugar pyrophosphorylase family protein
MKALLLAAGRGTRLAPLTGSTPKILAKVGNRSLLEHQLTYLQRNGVTAIALNVHHHADQVLACLRSLHLQVPVTVSHEPALLGTAGALTPLRDFLTEPILVLYGDVVTDASIVGLMDDHRDHSPLATVAVYRSTETEGKGVVSLAGSTREIEAFVEKPAQAAVRTHNEELLINAGIYVVSPEVLDLIGTGASDFGRDVWPRALAEGRLLRASVLDACVRDVGTPAELAAVNEDLASGALSW